MHESVDQKWRREEAVKYCRDVLKMSRTVVFGCDECGAVNECPYAFDPYNMDGDCLAEK